MVRRTTNSKSQFDPVTDPTPEEIERMKKIIREERLQEMKDRDDTEYQMSVRIGGRQPRVYKYRGND